MNIHNLLLKIISNHDSHACWLNSLSYLEYRGVRKILRSQSTNDMNLSLLQHIFEEAKHSMMLKRFAIQLGGQLFASYTDKNTLVFSEFKKYFYSIDMNVNNLLVEKSMNISKAYQLTSWIIEVRAIYVYKIYNQLLKSSNFNFNLQFLLNDEEKHLQEFANINFISKVDLNKLLYLEELSFNELIAKIENGISNESLAPLLEIESRL